jgi:hypothetical protein
MIEYLLCESMRDSNDRALHCTTEPARVSLQPWRKQGDAWAGHQDQCMLTEDDAVGLVRGLLQMAQTVGDGGSAAPDW